MTIDSAEQEKQRALMMAKASEATELVIVGMAEADNEMFNAESEGVAPTFWDVYLKFNEVGDEWDIEEASFHTEEDASDFADILEKLVPEDVVIESM